MTDLTIILRTCLKSKLDAGVDQKFKRICGSDRREMILKCLNSLVNSIVHSKLNIKLIVLDDASDEDFIEEVKHYISACRSEFISLDCSEGVKSFNWSAYQQFKLASEVDGLVYSVEDDYLHAEDAIESMLTAYGHLQNRFNQDTVMIFPFDCPFRYEQGREEPTFLLHDGKRYWRQVKHTTNTFLVHSSVLKKHFEVFKKLALEYPSVNEQHTINMLYKGFGYEAPITVFNPIPSLAYHLSYADPVEIKTPLNWRDIWNNAQ